MLTFTGSEEKQNTGFHLLGTVKPSVNHVRLISDNISLISSTNSSDDGFDTCSFYSGPSDLAIMTFAETSEALEFVAYTSGESCGSIAYTGGGESCGSVAYSGGACSVSTGSCCSYSC